MIVCSHILSVMCEICYDDSLLLVMVGFIVNWCREQFG
jgi:hypothetical protein